MAVDFIMVVDQTFGMRNFMKWLKSFVPYLNTGLRTKNIGSSATCLNQYAVIGFGSAGISYPTIYNTDSGSSLFSIKEFADVSVQLSKGRSGYTKYGYWALSVALINLPLRNSTRNCQVKRHLLLMTDGDNVFSGLRRSDIEALLTKNQAYLHVIVHQDFAVNGSQGIGVTANGIGYKESTNDDVCFDTNLDNDIGEGYGETHRDYTSLALQQNVAGTAWNILRLNNPATNNAMRCALAHEIQARFTGNCFNCSCNSFGQEECQQTDASAANQCACLNDNGVVSTAWVTTMLCRYNNVGVQ